MPKLVFFYYIVHIDYCGFSTIVIKSAIIITIIIIIFYFFIFLLLLLQWQYKTYLFTASVYSSYNFFSWLNLLLTQSSFYGCAVKFFGFLNK